MVRKTEDVRFLFDSILMGFSGGSAGKESACGVRDLVSVPGWGRSPGGGNGNPLHYSRLENPMDRGAWWATVCGVSKSWAQLSNQATITTCAHKNENQCRAQKTWDVEGCWVSYEQNRLYTIFWSTVHS